MNPRKNKIAPKLIEPNHDPISNGSSSADGYSVEARCCYHTPSIIAGVAYDSNWRRVHFEQAQVGVPERVTSIVSMEGYHTYAAAQALRWWFIAHSEAEHIIGALCLETRLVRHRIEQTRRVVPLEYCDPQDGRGEVPEDMIAPATGEATA